MACGGVTSDLYQSHNDGLFKMAKELKRGKKRAFLEAQWERKTEIIPGDSLMLERAGWSMRGTLETEQRCLLEKVSPLCCALC